MFQDVSSLPCNPRSVQDAVWETRLLGSFSVFFSRARRPEQKGVAEYTWELWRPWVGGQGHAGELEAVLKEMEKTCAGEWPECQCLMGLEEHFECV